MDIPDITETEKAVFDAIKQRWKIGRERYGVGINFDQQKTLAGWLDEAIEEAADQLQYLVAMRVMMNKEGNDGNKKT